MGPRLKSSRDTQETPRERQDRLLRELDVRIAAIDALLDESASVLQRASSQPVAEALG